jgi:RluA family pseudouridine synthase
MQQSLKFTVGPEDSGLKLLDFLKINLEEEYSGKQIKRWIENKNCRLNGKVERFAAVVVGRGDRIEFLVGDEPVKGTLDKSRVLYEDNDLLIYDKPSGIASDDPKFLRSFSPNLLVHRLDKETSGALIFAKSAAVKEIMIERFREKRVQKEYLALVDKVPSQQSGRIENSLAKIREFHGQAIWGVVDEGKGSHALTEWERLKIGPQAALLLCRPLTGRTHQIRVHLSAMGHPILGDTQYGHEFKCTYHAPRCLLHAHRLEFDHPTQKKRVAVEAAIPSEMQAAIEVLCSKS